VLLHWLLTLGYRNLIVCHLNHKLRGRSSDADERFVKRLAVQSGLEFASSSVDVRSSVRREKLSLEAAARLARYRFFASVAKRHRCRTIFLGHHADDLVETFLINLFRGAGSAGLSSIRPRSRRRIENVELEIIRPLLSVWRGSIDRYLHEKRLAFREDASNADVAMLRNRIRRRVIPYLEKNLGRNVRQSIWRTAIILGEEEDFIADAVPEPKAELAVKALREMPAALQRRTVRQWLKQAGAADVGFDVIERVRALLPTGAATAKTNLSGGRYVRRRAGKLFLE